VSAGDPLQRVRDAAAEVRAAETNLDEARVRFRRSLAEAREAGVTVTALAQELGVSRTRVRQLLDEAERHG
jgi:DNA-directed RNA polymerase sigma subunit (sigma70/sigma32)